MSGLPPQPSMLARSIVATIAVLAGGYAAYDFGKDFEFIKFEPFPEEEVERRKKEKVGMTFKQLDTRTLDYTPEAKERLKKLLEEERKQKEQEKLTEPKK